MSVSTDMARDSKPLAGRRVLVIEDEYFLADDIGRALSALGADVVGPTGYLEDGFALLEHAGSLDAAVLDVNIRSESVFPVARELQARRVPFVFTTGYDRIAIGSGFDDVPVWEKPIDVLGMASELTRLIGARLT
jgi:CheY-like chemotaxis protein